MRKEIFIVIILIESSDNMKNRGFTLVELLGVIIILGMLGTICTIVITDSIETSKENSIINSAKQIVKTITLDYTTNDNFTTDELDILSFDFKGEKPDEGYIQFNEKEKVRFYMKYDKYCVIKKYDSELDIFKLNDSENCNWDKVEGL